MKRPSLLEGIGVALAASLGAGAAYAGLGLLLPAGLALRGVIAALAGGYLLYLLARGPSRVGRVSLVALWALVALVLWFWRPSLALYVLAHAGLIWLARVLYHQSGILTALLDGGLVALGLGAAVWAAGQSGSLVLACWSFFLVQALFVTLPAAPGPQAAVADPFEQAYRTAESALRTLASRP